MKCSDCHQPFTSALDMRKRIEIRQAEGEPEKSYGIQMEAGPLKDARGRIVKILHNRCFYRVHNKENREQEALAREALSVKQGERAADPGHQPRREQDWRDQTVAEIGDLSDGTKADHAQRAAGMGRRADQ